MYENCGPWYFPWSRQCLTGYEARDNYELLYQDDESRRYLRDHNVVEPRFESRDEWLNALVVQHAADYKASGNSWNVRDSHMHEVVQYMLMQGYRVIMHAHNSHVLDARAHSRAERGEVLAIVSFTDSLTHKASG